MRQIIMNLGSSDSYLFYGEHLRQGEHLAAELVVNLNEEFQGYRYLLVFQLNENEAVYTEELFPIENRLTYPIPKELLTEPGMLKVELQAFEEVSPDNRKIIKSAITKLKVAESLEGVVEIMPEPYVPWYTLAVEASTTAIEQANIATQKAEEVENIRDSIVTEEEARQIAEADRVSNEQNRIEAENERIIEENIRKSNEVLRQTNENTRNNNENERVLAENERIANEEARQTNEQNRETAETARDTAEAIRANNEAARIAAEQARIEAENTREANEATRQSNEVARQAAESDRAAAEEERISAEQDRITAENQRIENENIRQDNENARIEAEQARVEAENLREQTIAGLDGRLKQQELKILKVEKDVDEYRKVMSQVNINQEPKQKATGYGVISLPPNAAEGQISGVIKGHTITQILDYNPNTWEEWEITGLNTVENGALVLKRTDTYTLASLNANFKPNTKYGFLVNVVYSQNVSGDKISCWEDAFAGANTSHARLGDFLSQVGNSKIILISKPDITNNRIRIRTNANNIEVRIRDLRIFELPPGSQIEQDFETLSADELAQKYPFVRGTKSTVSAMRLKSVSEDESEVSTAYVTAKDEEGNIVELRSLPNGTKDEINVTDRKLIKRIGEKSNIANGMVIDFADMAEGGTYYAWNEDGETEAGVKGDTLGIDATTLIYQLAEPVEIPVQVSGTLLSYPSGTVYVENVVADAGLYSDGITVLHQDLPIKSIEKISKIDYETGLETILDASKAVIASDKLSFTHPDLKDGDIVFFIYEYDRESTIPEVEVEFYDSRYVVKDSATGKFYKWSITVTNGTPSIQLTEV